MARLVVGDDHKVFLDALSAVLAGHGFGVTEAHSVTEVIEAVRRERPEVCLIDRHFGGADGLAAIEPILAASHDTRVLVLSADPDAEAIRDALLAGASGYLHKTRGVAALTAAVDRALRGEVVVDVPERSGHWSSRPAAADHVSRLAAFLTPRERECLGLLVEGLDTGAMAASQGISRATVRTHVQSLLIKLGVHSRLEAAALAVRYRLVDDEAGRAVRRPAS